MWSVEKKDVLNVIYYEYIDYYGFQTTDEPYLKQAEVRWDVQQITVSGATSLFVGALTFSLHLW